MSPRINTKNRLFTIGIVLAVAMMLIVPSAMQLSDSMISDAEDSVPTYSVSYDKNSAAAIGTVPASGNYAEGSAVAVLFDEIPYNNQYAFVGWELFQGDTSLGIYYPDESRNDPSTGQETAARTFTMPASAVVLKAVWSTDADTMVITSAGPLIIDYQNDSYVVTSEGTVVDGTAGINNFIIRSSAATWSGGISISNTAAKDASDRLRLVLDGSATAISISMDSSSPSAISVLNSSYLNLQYIGSVTLEVDNLSVAVINVASGAEVLIMGENNTDSGTGSESTLTLNKNDISSSAMTGSGIGGNSLENSGAVRVESGAVTIAISNLSWNHVSGIGGGGISGAVNSDTGASASYVEINGGTLNISNTGQYVTGAGIGGGGSNTGIGGDSGYVVINGGSTTITLTTTAYYVYGAGIGGGGTEASTVAQRAGNITGFVQSGGSVSITLTVGNPSFAHVYGAGIGGGGTLNGTGGTITAATITGGSVSISIIGGSDRGSYGAGIGGGGTDDSNAVSGAGGIVSIKNATVTISMNAPGDINGAGIGGGGTLDGTPASNGTTIIESSVVNITQTSTGDMVAGAGIGGGGHTYNTHNDGSGGSITIKSGTVNITQSASGYGLNAAGIGGGGSYDSGGTPGPGGTISIEGGQVTISKTGSATCRGTGIGGGGRCDTDNKGSSGQITISGGSVDINISSNTNSTVSIGGGTESYVTINGGTISLVGNSSSVQPIGTYQSGTGSLVIDGGAVRLANSGTLTGAVNSSGDALYKVTVDLSQGSGVTLPAERNLYSVFVKTTEVNGGLYRDFHVPYKHLLSLGSTTYDTSIYLYLPASDTVQSISAEVTSDGMVKRYTATVTNAAVNAAIQDGSSVYYRVLYQGTGLRFKYDTVHMISGGTFSEILESAGIADDGAPHTISITMAGAEVPDTDYTYSNFDDQTVTSVGGQITGPTVTGKLIVTADSEKVYTITYLDTANQSNSLITYVYKGSAMNLAAADLFAAPSGQAFADWKYYGGVLSAGVSYTPTVDTTFYAEWASSSVNVTITGDNFTILYPTTSAGEGNVYGTQSGSDFLFILQFSSGYDPGSIQFNVTGTAGSVTGSNGVYTIGGVLSDLTVEITVSKFSYEVTVEEDDTGSFYTLDKSQGTVEYGDVFTFTITPVGAHSLNEFLPVVNGMVRVFDADGSLSVTIVETTTIEISNNGQHYISIPEGTGYTTSPAGGGLVEYGDQFVFTITLAEGYSEEDTTVSFSDNGLYGTVTEGEWSNGSKTYTIDNVTGNITVTITAQETQYGVKIPKSDNYTISSTSSQDDTDPDYLILKVTYGGDVSFSLTPAEGYDITRFTAAAASGGSNGSIFAGQSGSWLVNDVTGDMVIQINAVKYQYSLTFTLTNCGIRNTGSIETVEWGDDVSVTIRPFSGYKYDSITVSGQDGMYAWAYDEDTGILSITGVKTDLQITAVCVAGTYTITYDPNGGSGGPQPVTVNYNTEYAVASTPEPTRTGYTFAGWSVNPNASVSDFSEDSTILITSDITLYAVWSEDTVTVTFDPGYAGPSTFTQNFLNGVQGTLTYQTFTRTGYTFAGWKVGTTDTILAAGATTTFSAATTLYAQWTPITVTVTFDANQGAGAPSAQPFSYGVAADLTSDVPTRTGYTFSGWSADPNASSAAYSAGDEATFTSDTTLYAVWSPNPLTVTYNAGEDGTGSQKMQNTFYGDYVQLYTESQGGFTRDGYHMTGWTDTDGGTVVYGLGEMINITSGLTLYPVWEQDTATDVTITFDPGYSGPSTFTQTVQSGIEAELTYRAFTRTGYTFMGWSEAQGAASADYIPGGSMTVTTATTLYAVWEKVTVAIIFNANGGTGTMGGQMLNYGEADNIEANTYTMTGYTFMGWSADPNGTVTYTDQASITLLTDAVLYAIWSADPLTVTYNAGEDGTGSQEVQNTFYGNYLQLYDESQGSFARSGYHITGWTDTDGSTTVLYGLGQTVQMSADLVLYPVWEQDAASDVTITFDPDYSGGPSAFTQTVRSGVESSLTYQTFARTGYTFMGWSETQGSSSADYLSGDAITVTADTTLYAVWNQITVSVTFNSNGGMGTMGDQILKYGESENLNANAYTRTGYTFSGWSADPNGSVTYADQASITLQADMILYAIWSKNSVTVTYTAGTGATGDEVTDASFLYDEYSYLSGLPSGWSMDEYTLTGWTDGTNTYGLGEMAKFTSDITLTGIWTHDSPGDITITYDPNGASGGYTETWQENIQGTLGYPRAVLEGHTFSGWKIGTTDTILAAGATTTFSAATTLYAQWTPITVTVTFDANLGTDAPSAQPFSYGVAADLTTDVPTRTGYSFAGWSTDPNATSAAYSAGEEATFTSETTLYAIWSANPLTITYNAGDDGIGSQKVQNLSYGDYIQLYTGAQSGFTRSGYHMTGWSDTDGGIVVYGLGQTVQVTSSLTLYPVWGQDAASDITITFDPDYPSGPAAFTQTVKSGIGSSLTYQTFTRDGYDFIGWSATQGSSSADYLSGDAITVTADTTLYAVWDRITISVTFNANGGTGTMADQTLRYGESENLNACTYTRAGYTFSGWSADPNGSVTYADQASVTLQSDTTLYAIWSKNQITVTYTAGTGATGDDVTDSSFLYDEYGNLSGLPAGWSMDGYTLTGWTDGTNTYGLGELAKFTSNTILAGIWTQDSSGDITITYDPNGASGGYAETWQENVQGTLGYPHAILEGHTFAGWKVGTTDTILAAGSTTTFAAATTLYAQWTPVTVTVTFDANLGTGAPPEQQFSYGIADDLTTDVPARTGYTFSGWSTDPNATSAEYSPGEEATFTSDKTLYAVWSANPLTITYNAGDDGTGSQQVQDTAYGSYMQLYTEAQGGFTRSGYHMTGWTDTDGSTTALYGLGQMINVTASMVLYPVWEQDAASDITITFDPDYSGPSAFTQTVQSGTQAQLTYQTFSRTGYTFMGWSENSGDTLAAYLPGGNITVTSATTLYAVWEKVTVSIIFNANGGTGTMADQILNYGEAEDLTANAYTRTGYTFSGWSTDPNGTATYADQAPITLEADEILYAVWSKNQITVTYTAGTGATGDDVTDSSFLYDEYGNLSGLPAGWSMDGYTLTGWTDSNSNTYALGELAKFTASTTLTGIWTHDSPGDITITYNGNGAAGGYTETWQENVQRTVGYPRAVLEGHTFAGWKIGTTDTILAAGSTTTFSAATTLYAQWTPITVTVTFDANLGTDAPTAQPFSYGVAADLTTDVPTRTGYAFAGWSTDPNATLEEYSVGEEATFTSDKTLYAVWSANPLTVTYDAGDDGTGSQKVQNAYYGDYIQLYTDAQSGFTRSGYHMTGWTDTDGNTTVLFGLGETVNITSGLTLYPVWEQDAASDITITFDPDYSGPSTFTQTVQSGIESGLTYQTFSRTGYAFMGWSESSGDTSADYLPGSDITVTSAKTLYAVWEKVTVSIIFNANNGNGTMASQTVDYGTAENLDANTFARTGYTFSGWSIDPNGTVTYADQASVTLQTDTTLYAIWTPISLTVTYDPGTLGAGSQDIQNTHYDDYFQLYDGTQSGFTRDGYHMTGWTDTDGSLTVLYGLGYTVQMSASLVLYPVWELDSSNQDTVTITFDPGEYSGPSSFTRSVPSGVSTALTYQTFTRDGYNFLGWATVSGGPAVYQSGDMITVSSDTTLYATWSMIQVTATFDANLGTGGPASQIFNHGVSDTLDPSQPTRDGYDFLGWSTDPNATSATYSSGASVSFTADTTLYAAWSAKTMTITYDPGSLGTGAQVVQSTCYDDYVQLYTDVQSGFTRDGYHMLGWSDIDGDTAILYRLGDMAYITGNITLYPVWDPDSDLVEVTITFDPGYAGQNAFTQVVYSGEPAPLTHRTFTRTGYTFGGWAMSAGGSAVYQPGDTITASSDTTLYAVWTTVSVTVTFDANLGTGGPYTQSFDYGVPASLSTAQPAREGYSFVGWSTDPNATSAAYSSGGTALFTTPATLYAVWTGLTVTVTYDVAGGTWDDANTASAKVGGTYQVSSTVPTKDGYAFRGWNTNADGTGTTYGSGESAVVSAGGLQLYAIWDTPAGTAVVAIQSSGGEGQFTYSTDGSHPTDNCQNLIITAQTGDMVRIMASTPPENTKFDCWVVDGVKYYDSEISVRADGAQTVYANFVPINPESSMLSNPVYWISLLIVGLVVAATVYVIMRNSGKEEAAN